jgi:hypothetical protein
MFRKTMLGACAGAVVCLAAGTAGAAANFAGDVNTAINRGLDYLATSGAFTGVTGSPACPTDGAGLGGLDRGLPLLALLEKRATGNLSDPPQGYAGASTTDKERMRGAVSCILRDVKTQSYESYYYGNWLMALALYARTGGPDKGVYPDLPDNVNMLALGAAIDKMTNATIAAQGSNGMWGYTGPGSDSSTTQFAAAGLAGAKGYYVWKGDASGIVASITTALAKAGAAYKANGSSAGSDLGSCDRIQESERGHGYSVGNTPSLQQTASGLWVQVLGGASVNDASVQAYLQWLRNHYRWQDSAGMDSGYPSFWYYMWSSMKGLLTIQESGGTPNAGNLGSDSYGHLGPNDDPDSSDSLPGTCAVRQLHRDPAAVARNSTFGSDTGGYYKDELPSVYFDYASGILSHVCDDGRFSCNSPPGSWGANWYSGHEWDRSSWGLLVLQRATGGACVDANNDGKCDGDGNAEPSVYGECDVDGSGRVTMSDVWAMLPFAKSRTRFGGSPSLNAADAVNFGARSGSGGWFESSGDSEVNIADFARCIFKANGR